MNILDKTYYYFIGAGGIGMSALARYFKSLGKVVLGYDKTLTDLTKQLEEEGIDLHYDDDITKIPNFLNPENTLVIHTPAVPTYLKEYQYFLQNNFKIMKRSEVLGEITANTYGIAVAGTHGKTTTSSILGFILKEAGLESTAFLGGVVENYDSNIIMNGGEITVSEADEFDRSFLRLSPKIGIITSIDADHLDIYGDKETFEQTFLEFGRKVTEKLFIRMGLPLENAITYGVESGADYDAVNLSIENGIYHFDVKTPNGDLLKKFSLQLPGKHNVENATAAIAVAHYMQVPFNKVSYAISNFRGVKRRFNRWDINGKIYIDDYAHHPTELNAVIDAAREMFPGKKVLGVFQPHLFSRTRDFADGFAESLSRFDELILLDIYPAREEPIEGVHSQWLADKVNLEHKEVSSLQDTMAKIKSREFDVLVTTGAGNIDTLVKPIKQWLNEG